MQDDDSGRWLTSPENIAPAEVGAWGAHDALESMYEQALHHSISAAARRSGSPDDLPERVPCAPNENQSQVTPPSAHKIADRTVLATENMFNRLPCPQIVRMKIVQ